MCVDIDRNVYVDIYVMFILVFSLNVFMPFFFISKETAYDYLPSIFLFDKSDCVHSTSHCCRCPCYLWKYPPQPTQVPSFSTLHDHSYVAALYLVNVGVIEKIHCVGKYGWWSPCVSISSCYAFLNGRVENLKSSFPRRISVIILGVT